MALTFPTNPTPGTTSNGGLSGGFQSWTWDGIAWKLAATPFVATSSTITSDMITNGTIVDADVSGTAAIALSKIQPVFGTNGGLTPAANQIHVQNSSNAAVSALVGGDLTASVAGSTASFTIGAGKVDATKTSFGGAWSAVTISSVTLTGTSTFSVAAIGSASAMIVGKTAHIRGSFSQGTIATAASRVIVALTGFTVSTDQIGIVFNNLAGPSQSIAPCIFSGATVTLGRDYINQAYLVGESLAGTRFSGTVELA